MNKFRLTILVLLLNLIPHIKVASQEIIDLDGNKYPLIFIADNYWIKKNLNVSRFRNGDPIKEAKTSKDWIDAWRNKEPAWCYLDNNSENGENLGKLYNWFAVNDSRGLAPKNCRIPNINDWLRIIQLFNGEGYLSQKMRNSSFEKPQTSYRDVLTGFGGSFSTWWTSEISNENNAWSILLGQNHGPSLQKLGGVFGNGISVRCVCDQ